MSYRTFDSGATRASLGDKPQYEGYLNPLVLHRFAQYMQRHQTMEDGSRRAPDNWQKGIPKDALIDSGIRHIIDIWLHHRGYSYAAREDLEESLCAAMFFTMAYLHSVLEDKHELVKNNP